MLLKKKMTMGKRPRLWVTKPKKIRNGSTGQSELLAAVKIVEYN